MRLITCIATLLFGVSSLTSCIKNDIPYPVVELAILSYEGVGFRSEIDPLKQTVTLHLEETTDPTAVEVTSATVTEQATTSRPLTGLFDMRAPLQVTLSLYQDYLWTIRAVQPIERYFTVRGQVGATEIDTESRTATVYVAKGTNLQQIEVQTLKLGPAEVTTMTPSKEELKDFRSVRYVYLNYPALKGTTERWQLYVRETDVKVQLTQVDAWATVAYLYGAAQEGTKVGFRYRRAGTTLWNEAPQVEQSGGVFTTRITGLEPESEYEFVAYSNEDESPVVSRQTEQVVPLHNGGFEEWCTIDDIIYPYKDADSPYWATGNVGASIVNVTLTEAVTDIRPGSSGKVAARLTSKYASVLGVGKFAAGNLYIGKYVRNDGTNGIVHFGRPFTARPVALRGWMKYNLGLIDRIQHLPPGETLEVGDPDTGMIYIALGDWSPSVYGGTAESPIEIATRRIQETAFDPHSEAVIGYGELALHESVGEWTEFTIPIEYVATDRIPTHLMIVCSASRLGDYFTGSTKSVMWVDDFELVYE
ncbi:MAG: PCMD domain-containing protein [Alistipes sp.]|nr:PCMD domain-containing protein [Alistipes sp.]